MYYSMSFRQTHAHLTFEKKLNMKHYANTLSLVLLASLLFAGYRSITQHSTVSHHQQADSLSVQLSTHAHGSLSGQVHSYNNTRQSADSITKLPAAQSLEIKGSEILQTKKEQTGTTTDIPGASMQKPTSY